MNFSLKKYLLLPKIKISNFIIFLIACVLTLLFWQKFDQLFLPLDLDLAYRNEGNPSAIRIYSDLNNDGYSEHIVYNKFSDKNISGIITWNYSGIVEEQFNLVGDVVTNGVIIGDINSDGDKDIIVFYTNQDSLFFDAINPVNKSLIIKKKFFISKPDTAILGDWDIEISKGSAILDINSDGKNELVIGLRTGYAIYPRGIYTYDFVKMNVTNKLEIAACPENITIDDFNNDGNCEICFTTPISGNVNSNELFNDQTSWVFFLDHNLGFLSKPKSYGKYPSSGISAQCLFNDRNGKKILIAEANYQENKSTIYQFDHNFLQSNSSTINFKYINSILTPNENNEGSIYLATSDGDLIELNKNLDQIKNIKTGLDELVILTINDFTKSGEEDILLANSTELRLYNPQLELLGEINLKPMVYIRDCFYSTRKNGNDKNRQICLSSNKSSLLISVNSNEKQILIYVLLFVIFFTVISILFLIKISILQFYYYLKTFRFLFYKAETGYCLVDTHLDIKYTNQKFLSYLNLQNIEANNLSELFYNHKNLSDLVLSAKENKKEIKEKLIISSPDMQFNGVVNAIPLKIFRNKVIAVLIEIKNYTQPIVEDRLLIWGKSIQKIAHDIKTPLSTIALNLKSIQLNLEKSDITNPNIAQDIIAAKNEIERIKNLTKDFLKFVDLDKPNFQSISTEDVIIESLKRFEALNNDDLKIEYKPGNDNKFIWADPRQIELVIHILVENSIDALKGIGLILVETDLVQNLAIKKDMVQISVTDNGPGISKELLNKIFEPHFSTKKDGTGMGLAFAKKIIGDHRGEMDIHSRVGFGTTFKFTIPIFIKN